MAAGRSGTPYTIDDQSRGGFIPTLPAVNLNFGRPGGPSILAAGCSSGYATPSERR